MGGIWAVVAAVVSAVGELLKYLASRPKPETEKAPTASSARGAWERKERELKKSHPSPVEKTVLDESDEHPKKPSKSILN